MASERRHLFFRRLQHELADQLNFEFGLEKYKLLSRLLDREEGLLSRLVERPGQDDGPELAEFLAVCRLLFQQHRADPADFDRIVREAVRRERRAFQEELRREAQALFPREALTPPAGPAPSAPKPKTPEKPAAEAVPSAAETEEEPNFYQQEWREDETPAEMELQVNLEPVADPDAARQHLLDEHPQRYILTKDYLPIASRQMAKTWRYLQFRVPDRASDQMDIPATVRQTAREGFFFEPVYVPRTKNKPGGLVILADRGGSMTPFHALTDEVIHTARTDGGHEQARFLVFRNLPQGHFLEPEPRPGTVALDAFLRQIAAGHTAVLIISDAGAARGRFNARRVQGTRIFLEQLKHHAAAVAWLNPMPLNRWSGSSAGHIAQRVPMFPVLEAGYLGFDKAVKVLRGQGNYEGFSGGVR